MLPAAQVPRVVLDTNVWLDCLMFEDPRLQTWVAALAEGRCQALICERTREEWLRMVAHARFQPRSRSREAQIEVFHSWTELCPDPPPCGLRPRDPDDQVFVDLAVHERASHLLTRDKALLKLRRKALAHQLTISLPEGCEGYGLPRSG